MLWYWIFKLIAIEFSQWYLLWKSYNASIPSYGINSGMQKCLARLVNISVTVNSWVEDEKEGMK